MNPIRCRQAVDDRHSIRNPINIDPVTNRIDAKAAAVWANTLVKTRIPQLFLNRQGLEGHVEQLQNELNRLNVRRLEGCSINDIDSLTEQMKFVRSATKKAIEAARQNGFSMPNNLMLEFHFISDRLKI